MTQTTRTAETAARHRSAAVYRLYDAGGALLYIGSAYDPQTRAKKHHTKPWWPQVARREDDWHPSRQAAFAAETDAITAENPTYNRISGPGPVLLPPPRRRPGGTAVELEEVDEYMVSLRSEPPGARARKLGELLEEVTQMVRVKRRSALLEMQATGMTYRQMATATSISFGRVRQILAEETDLESEE